MYNVDMNLDGVGCPGIVYDGVNLSDIFEVHDIHVPLLPSIEAVTQEMAGRPGAYFQSRKVRTREITMKLGLNAGSRCPLDIYHAWRENAGKVAKSEPRKLYLKDDKYIWAMLVGETGIENLGYRGVAELTFACFDPFFYGKERSVALSASLNTVHVQGGCATFPVVEVACTGSTVTLEDADTGDMVRAAGLASGSTLVIDPANYRCTVNGNYKPCDMSVTDFWPLEPGDARLRLTGGTATMTYRERWL